MSAPMTRTASPQWHRTADAIPKPAAVPTELIQIVGRSRMSALSDDIEFAGDIWEILAKLHERVEHFGSERLLELLV